MGLAKSKVSSELLDKFLIPFEKTTNNNRVITLNKLLTAILLLTRDYPQDKITHLFGIYKHPMSSEGVLKRSSLRQLLDHLGFTVIYAIPNLSFHSIVNGFGVKTEKCKRIIEIKLEMQKKVLLIHLLLIMFRYTMIS